MRGRVHRTHVRQGIGADQALDQSLGRPRPGRRPVDPAFLSRSHRIDSAVRYAAEPMKTLRLVPLLLMASAALGYEEPVYEVLRQTDRYEIRDYKH